MWIQRPYSRLLEGLLVSIGLACLGYVVFVTAVSLGARQAGSAFAPSTTPSHDPVALQVKSRLPGAVMGRLEIPKLKVSVPILSDDDSSSLLKGVGHIPGTALPGGLGTMGLAGHRDMYLRPLRLIAPKMDIRVVGRSGTYHYEVDSTEIVKPSEVRVLDVVSRPSLTLVTCYPFYYVGSAPLRFIVHAHLLSALPDVAPAASLLQ